MHRTQSKRSSKLASFLLGLSMTGMAAAQDAPLFPPQPDNGFGQSQPLQLPSTISVSQAPAAPQGGAQPPAPQGVGQPAAKPAQPRTGAVVVPIQGTQRIGHSSKKRLAKATTPRPNVARIQAIEGDPTQVLITGLEAGATTLTLTDEDGKEETIDIVVQFDVEYLRTLLVRAVPTANIQPIPAANNTVILSGSVARSEDIQVVLSTAASVVGGAERVINALRVGGVMQVQLDVVVAQVSRGEFRRMSFDFINVGNQHIVASTVGRGFTVPTTGIAGTLPAAPTITNGVGTPNGVPANLFLGIFNDQQGFFGLLQVLRDESVAKLMAEPKLITMSGRPASFLSGGEQAIPVPAGLGQIGVQFEEFGTRVNFLPIVLGNGKIHLEVEPEVSDLNPAFGTSINGTVVPGRTTQRIHTTVELEPGQTYVLGGMIQRGVTGTSTKVPVLGDLPFLGTMFSTKSYNETESELVIVVTPYLVDAMSCDQAPKTFPGQETRSPDNFELFLEGILEAPRGPRQVIQGKHYVPAYKNGPTAGTFPCAGDSGRCATNGCSTVETGSWTGTAAIGVPEPMRAAPRELGLATAAQGSKPMLNAAPGETPRPMTLPTAVGSPSGGREQQ